jgi:hypothetical protein
MATAVPGVTREGPELLRYSQTALQVLVAEALVFAIAEVP